MDELAERTKGAWRPSPGSIYPTLRRLSNEGLVSSVEQDGRRVFQLTEAGRKAAAEAAGGAPPWERLAPSAGDIDLRKTVFSLGAAAKQVATSGTTEQIAQAHEVLTQARKDLYGLLAE
jgi:DNA-binding PadR family transcriptional regulator